MKRTSGFTIIELVIVIVVAGVLVGISVVSFGDVQNRLTADQGIRTFKGMHARTRAQAIEGGMRTELWVHSAGDSVWIVRNGTTLETVRFDTELGVEILASPGIFRLCMTSRGFADPDCNTFTTANIEFSQGSAARSLEILPLGQLIEP